jgi:hypothetical protein
MDMGGMVVLVGIVWAVAIAVCLVINLVAAVIGAQASVVHRRPATVLGFGLGTFATLVVGWALLTYTESGLWPAFVAGVAVAYGSAKGFVAAVEPANAHGTEQK